MTGRYGVVEIDERELAGLRRAAASYENEKRYVRWGVIGVISVILLIVGVVIVAKLVGPQLNLYKANTEKKAAIAEAKALADSAEFKAQAEVTRSEGVAEANKIIAESITDEYVRWLYVDQLDEVQGQVIYIPTEGGLPILEATRQP